MGTLFIGLPVYNGDEFLETAIKCLTVQTYTDFELLIADNASNDRTEEIARHYSGADPRIRYHRHAKNLGAAPNFNFCVEEASGKYFKWMSHDDYCDPTYLEKCVSLLEQDPGAVLCHAGVSSIDSDGNVVGTYDKERDFNDPDPVIRFDRAMALNHSCVSVFGVMRLEVLRKTPAIASFVGSDRSLLAELALHGRLEYVPERLFRWRDHKSRSVRMTRKERITWFDSRARKGFSAPYTAQFLANQKAALKSPQPVRIKLRALYRTLVWARKNWYPLYKDFRALGGSLIRYLRRQGDH